MITAQSQKRLTWLNLIHNLYFQIDPNKEIVLDVSSTSSDSEDDYATPLQSLREAELRQKLQEKLQKVKEKKEKKKSKKRKRSRWVFLDINCIGLNVTGDLKILYACPVKVNLAISAKIALIW